MFKIFYKLPRQTEWQVITIIVRASDLNDRLEELDIKGDGVTIASVDAVNMCPSIKLATIRKAVIIFSRKITKATKNTINLFLETIRLGMSSTFIYFNGEY